MIYHLDISAQGSHQTIRCETQASGPALAAEMRARVHAVVQRGSGDSAALLHSVCAYIGCGARDLRVSAHTDVRGWQVNTSGKVTA